MVGDKCESLAQSLGPELEEQELEGVWAVVRRIPIIYGKVEMFGQIDDSSPIIGVEVGQTSTKIELDQGGEWEKGNVWNYCRDRDGWCRLDPSSSAKDHSTSPTKFPRSAPLPPAAPERRQTTVSEGKRIIGDYLEKIRQFENISDDMTMLGFVMM